MQNLPIMSSGGFDDKVAWQIAYPRTIINPMIAIIAFLARFFTAIAAILGAVLIVPGITMGGFGIKIITVMIILALTNTSLKALLSRANLGCSVLSLGPILLAINTLAFWFADGLKFGLAIAGFWPAFWAGLLVSLVCFSMYFLVSDGS